MNVCQENWSRTGHYVVLCYVESLFSSPIYLCLNDHVPGELRLAGYPSAFLPFVPKAEPLWISGTAIICLSYRPANSKSTEANAKHWHQPVACCCFLHSLLDSWWKGHCFLYGGSLVPVPFQQSPNIIPDWRTRPNSMHRRNCTGQKCLYVLWM